MTATTTARPRAGRSPAPPAGLLAAGSVTALVALLPLTYLAIRGLDRGLGYAWDLLVQERTLRLTLRSIALAGTVTAACLGIGATGAWLVQRTDVAARRMWFVLLALPLAIPSYVAAFAWVAAFPQMQGFWAAALVLTATSYPYVYLPVLAALRSTDPAQEEAARALGKSATATFFLVTLRQVRPAAAAGSLLVALYVLSDFGAVSLVRYDTFTRVIYSSYRGSFDNTAAAVLSCLLVALTVGIVLAEARSRGRATHAPIGSGARRRTPRIALRRWRMPALAWLAAVTLVTLGAPAASLVYWLTVGTSGGLRPASLAAAALATVWLAFLGAIVTTALAVPVGILAARRRGWQVTALEQASYAGHALPGIVVALAMVFLGVNLFPAIYQRSPLLVLAYAVLFLPLAVGAVRSAVAQSPPALEEVARSLGRSPSQVLREITVPLAAPGVAAGFALVFLTCMKELPATLLLRPTGTDTLATELWSATNVGRYAEAAPYAALLVILAAVPTYLLGRDSAVGRADVPDVKGGAE